MGPDPGGVLCRSGAAARLDTAPTIVNHQLVVGTFTGLVEGFSFPMT